MKKPLEYIALAMGVFLIVTIDSYKTSTLLIGGVVFLAAWGWWMYSTRTPKQTLSDLPSSDDDLVKWLRATIKKIDKMGDK
jgi:hypothetical protein